MDKRIRIAGIVAALIFAVIIWVSPSNPPPIPAPVTSFGNEFVEIIATDLEKPWSIGFGDDKIFLTEKDGRVRIIESDSRCADMQMYQIKNGWMTNCYPENVFIKSSHAMALLKAIKDR